MQRIEEDKEQKGNGEESYYRSIATDFRIDLGDIIVEPKIFAPTAAGLAIIAKKYNRLYGIEIQLFDSSQSWSPSAAEIPGDNLMARFKDFHANFDFSQLKNKPRIGVILLHGNHHAIPIFLSQEDSGLYMMVFDSTSGARKKGYWLIANLFRDFTFLLNNGTRQADTGSCFTDAIYILKEALRHQKITGSNLLTNYLVEDEAPSNNAGRVNPFLRGLTKPNNFYLFKMPALLLKTSQRSEFVKESQVDMSEVVHGSGTTLEEHQERHRIRVTFLSKNLVGNASTFLHLKAMEHKEMIDNHKRAQAVVSFFKTPQTVGDKISEMIEDYLPYKRDI